jgi:hypothetical protein
MPRARSEYGGCSVRNRSSPRRSDTWCASTISSAGNVEQPNADLALVDQVGQRGQRLLDIGGGVGPVHLVEIDPVGLQPPQAVLDRRHDPAARVAAAVGPVAHGKVHLGGQHDVAAPAL